MNAITPFDTSDDHAASLRRCLSLLERHAPRLLLEHARNIQAACGLVRRACATGQIRPGAPQVTSRAGVGGRPECPKLQAAVAAWVDAHGLDGLAPRGAMKHHCAWHRVNEWTFRTTLSRRRRALHGRTTA